MYTVKELFYTLQGEGANTGRAAVFCRFAGCNLWSGAESERASAICRFCDTDFRGTDGEGGDRFAAADELAEEAAAIWTANATGGNPLVVCTGGEPLLQLDANLIEAFHQHGFQVAVETNGTLRAPEGIDHICVSPKANAPLALTRGHELKLVFPQEGADPANFEDLDFEVFFLQPMDGKERLSNTAAALRYCMAHPRWRLSLQVHKIVGIP